MKITRLLTLSALAAAAAFAQMTGTITITGSIPESISMTNQSDTLLSTTQDLGALVAANNATLATLASPVGVKIRSNKAFKLNAAVTAITPATGSDDGGLPITLRDIGFGITGKQITGASVGTIRTADLIAPIFDYTGTNAVSASVTNGKSPFDGSASHGSLADLSIVGTGSEVIHGNRISKNGNIQSIDNFMLLGFNVATLPQYFTPTTGFSATITLTPAVI